MEHIQIIATSQPAALPGVWMTRTWISTFLACLFVCLFVGIKPKKLYSASCGGREVNPLGVVTHGIDECHTLNEGHVQAVWSIHMWHVTCDMTQMRLKNAAIPHKNLDAVTRFPSLKIEPATKLIEVLCKSGIWDPNVRKSLSGMMAGTRFLKFGFIEGTWTVYKRLWESPHNLVPSPPPHNQIYSRNWYAFSIYVCIVYWIEVN